jgi:type IV pilus assembly protein PilC
MLEELGASANDSSFVVSFSNGIMAGRIAMVSVILVMAAFVLIYILNKSQGGKITLNKFFSGFSLTKKIMGKITAYRFASAMSLLLSSGMNVDSSMDMLLDIVEEPVLKEKIILCRDYMKSGDSFLDSVNKLSLFNGMHMQMLKMGQKVGEMDLVMNKLANIYEDESEQAINSGVSLVEPVLVGILSAIIGLILISVMLPLMNIMSAIG